MGIRVPFIKKRVGLGTVIGGLTRGVGIKACGGCREKSRWDERVVLVPLNKNA